MLKDDVIKLLNTIFKRGKIPIKVNDLFLFRPVYHEPPFEDFEPINDPRRLPFCNPLWIDFEIEHDNHRYVYQLRCKNDKGKFIRKHCWLKTCDIFLGDDPKKLEKDMKSNVNLAARILLDILQFLSRRSK